MTEAWAVTLVGWIALAVTAGLTLLVASAPQAGLARLTHRPEALPQVMAVRYAGQALLAGIALHLGDRAFLLALMLTFALVAFGDTAIYARAGHAFAPHLVAGIACLVAVVLLVTART